MKKRKISYFSFYNVDGNIEDVNATNLKDALKRRKSKKEIDSCGFGFEIK